MEETRKRIIKISKVIQHTTTLCMILFGVIAVIGLGVAFFPYHEDELPSLHSNLVNNANILPLDIVSTFMKDNNYRLQVMLAGIFISLMAMVLLFLICGYKKIFKKIINARTPFTKETAESLRKLSRRALLLVVFSTLMGIIIFLILRLIAYIFEYGAYLQEKADETNRIQEEMIMSFAEITENKSEQTGKHVRRVAEYSRIVALEMGLDEDRANQIRLASTMHDIGKLMIADEILEKPARLTDEEFAEIKKHPGYGGKLLKNVEGDVMRMAKTVALEHHERPDGRGYPEGKTLDKLSIESRIVAVADVYDALTSKRSYKQAWNEKDAYEEILKGKGTQFDEEVVEAFIKAYPKIDNVRQELQG